MLPGEKVKVMHCYQCRWFRRLGGWVGKCTHPDFQGERERLGGYIACSLAQPRLKSKRMGQAK